MPYPPYNQYLQYAPLPALPQYLTPYQQPAQQAQIPQNQGAATGGIMWVTEADAISYVPSAGPAVALWLRDKPTIYLKSLDNMGKPTTVILDYQERQQAANIGVSAPTDKETAYATKREFDALKAEVEALKKGGADNGESAV